MLRVLRAKVVPHAQRARANEPMGVGVSQFPNSASYDKVGLRRVVIPIYSRSELKRRLQFGQTLGKRLSKYS
jgi:hypothetical protein